MLQSINKNKLYLYFLFYIFLSSVFNIQLIKNYKNKFNLKNINIIGLTDNEKRSVVKELINFQNTNIFMIKEDEVLEKLNKFDFLESIYVNKIIPSSINLNLTKTSVLGKTLKNGEIFYIGKNEKLINSRQLFEKKNVPTVFGEFKVIQYLNLLDDLSNSKLDFRNIENFFYFKNKRWDLLFSDGTTLMLPSNNAREALKIYVNLKESGNLINIKIIDLRVKNQIILTHKNE